MQNYAMIFLAIASIISILVVYKQRQKRIRLQVDKRITQNLIEITSLIGGVIILIFIALSIYSRE